MNEELRRMLPELSAYADGELEGDDVRRVEAYLRAHPEAREIVDSYRGVDEQVVRLTSSKTDADWERLALRVDAALDADAATRTASAKTQSAAARRGGFLRWFTPRRVAFSSVGTIAAALMVFALYPFREELEPPPVAHPGAGTFESLENKKEGTLDEAESSVDRLRALGYVGGSTRSEERPDESNRPRESAAPLPSGSASQSLPAQESANELTVESSEGSAVEVKRDTGASEKTRSDGADRAEPESASESTDNERDADVAPAPLPAAESVPQPAPRATDLRKIEDLSTRENDAPASGYSGRSRMAQEERGAVQFRAPSPSRQVTDALASDETTFEDMLRSDDASALLVLAGELDVEIEGASPDRLSELLDRESRVWLRLVELNPARHCAAATSRAKRRTELLPGDEASHALEKLIEVCPPADAR